MSLHRVYWGSHGCCFDTDHQIGECVCACCPCIDHANTRLDECAAGPPYYGPTTRFYGEDARAQVVTPGAEG